MHLPSHPADSSETNTNFLRRVARLMLRAARSDHPSKALPVIRRVHAARAVPAGRITELYHARQTLQLKHMFSTVATELGYDSWDACKRDIERRPSALLDRFRLDLGAFGDYEHVWFSDAPAAQAWQREHGGRVVVYGSQAVVMST
ncbi:hypothetical protein [Massilia sp. ST3]|uniref:hypothetical protein n=1 Tax=Massilia sp. ST3 TaxID=2824903 RepID=UPI001B8268EE|nr:hypothetical protein [Massilia sp. ST3]MBQ5948781.1 hypothetical protein [Massilia sp. ST3]